MLASCADNKVISLSIMNDTSPSWFPRVTVNNSNRQSATVTSFTNHEVATGTTNSMRKKQECER